MNVCRSCLVTSYRIDLNLYNTIMEQLKLPEGKTRLKFYVSLLFEQENLGVISLDLQGTEHMGRLL